MNNHRDDFQHQREFVCARMKSFDWKDVMANT